jgi:serine/threonine protein kinase
VPWLDRGFTHCQSEAADLNAFKALEVGKQGAVIPCAGNQLKMRTITQPASRTKIGKFEILGLLGKGSMGEVYLGVDPVLGREVAIKTIARDNIFEEESGARFDREAKALAAMNHPNIVTLFDYGIDYGTTYLVMEYLKGDDLATLIEQRSLSQRELLEALAQACEGLAYAHDCGFVHQDLKPGNIRVVRWGNRIYAKLLDFGIATAACSNPAMEGSWVGTISYMAPEYLDSGQATPSSDLFAVGVIIYEILSGGRKPFTGDNPVEVLNAILKLPPTALEPHEAREVPAGLLDVVARALAKDPADRYPTATALASAIRAELSAPSPGRAASKAEPAQMFTKPKVLVINDSKVMRLYLHRCLEQAGYEVEEWVPLSPVEVPDFVKASAPDLILSDYPMAGCNGASLARMLQKADLKIPVLVITSFRDEEMEANLHKVGVKRVLSKPIRSDALFWAVKSALEHP